VNRESAERCTILRGLVGSTVHGLNVNDGIEDRDEMGVCVEPTHDAMALWDPFEQFIYRSAAEREGRENARSTAGDLDLTIYSLRKWIRLALKGNPTILLLLFTPDNQLTVAEETLQQIAAEHGKQVATHLYGQEINAETYAICNIVLTLPDRSEPERPRQPRRGDLAAAGAR